MAQKPFKDSITIYQGATFDVLRTWKTGTPAVPVDLTGCTARMHVRAKQDAPTALITLTTENGGIVLGGALGTVRRLLTPEATAALNPADFRTAVYDLEVVFPGGQVRRLLAGGVTVSPEVTRV